MLIGRGYERDLVIVEAKRYLTECLMVNPYILSVEGIEANFIEGLLTMKCKVKTALGEVDINV